MKNKKWLPKTKIIPASVFLTGASVLIIEVVAIRLLAPYFGNTIYTFSSVLSVVLAGLSIGYSLGGKLADKKPHMNNYFMLILASGLTLLTLNLLAKESLPGLSDSLSISTGPLVASMLFFFTPALMLGALSPYAVKLQSLVRPEVGVGEVAGQIFFWSTLGSIVGSLGSGFFLVPRFGVSSIFVSTSLFLVVLGATPLIVRSVLGLYKVIGVFVFASVVSVYSFSGASSAAVVYEKDGVYERLTVLEGVFTDDRPIRIFVQDRSNSGAMYLDESDPTDLPYGYAKYYSVALELADETEDALVIGAGIYSFPRALQYADKDIVTDVIDIEPDLEDIAIEYFGLTDTSRINSYTTDGRRFLNDSEEQYDIIFGDAFNTLHSIPAHLSTQEFYELTKSKLKPGGVFLVNIHGRAIQSEKSATLAQYKTISSVFKYVYVFAVESAETTELQNLMFFGLDQPLDREKLRESENAFAAGSLKQLVDFGSFDLDNQVLLTDDYVPIDYLGLKLLEQ